MKRAHQSHATGREHITVIAVQTTSLFCNRAGGNVEHTGKEFSRDLEPIQ